MEELLAGMPKVKKRKIKHAKMKRGMEGQSLIAPTSSSNICSIEPSLCATDGGRDGHPTC